jgi:hypothetical protein
VHGEAMQRQLRFQSLGDRHIVFDYEDVHCCDPVGVG